MHSVELFVLCVACILFTRINSEFLAVDDPEVYELYAAFDDERSIMSQRSGQATDTHSCGDIRSVPADVRSELSLPGLFQKYTDAYGIPVVSSSKVSDAALQRACYTARFLLADRYSIRNGYYKRNGRFALVGRSEKPADIPGVTGDEGFGATISVPVSVAREEYAVCEGSSGDMVLDMFAQGMVSLGANYEVSDFQSRLANIFDASSLIGAWDFSGDGASSAEAHFAEGLMKYYKDADTRVEFSYFQPYLYELIQELFPCNNDYINKCDDNNQEKSLGQRLRINAPECKLEPEKQQATTTTTPVPTTTTTQMPSSTTTTTPAPTTTTTQGTTPAATTPPTTIPVTTTPDPNCYDRRDSCRSLAIRGKCSRPSVKKNCQRSCVCNPPCFDLGSDCERKTSRCHDFVVKKTCAKTCGVCQ